LGNLIPERVWTWRGVVPLQILLMFTLTNIGWLLFRETNFHYLLMELSLNPRDAMAADWEGAAYFVSLVAIYSLPLVAHFFLDRNANAASQTAVAGIALKWRTVTASALFLAILVLRTANSGDFIYFKF